MKKVNNLISKLVKLKINDLSTFKQVRYSIDGKSIVSRSYFEICNIQYDFENRNFKDDLRLIYLNELKKSIIENNIKIYDNLPSDAPNVTLDFISLIDEEIINIELKELSKNTNSKGKLPDYCEVTCLLATGEIHKKGFDLFYKELKFESPRAMTKYLSKNGIITEDKNYQYINDSLGSGTKNIFASKKMLNNTHEYCLLHNKSVSEKFTLKRNSFNN